MQGKAKFFVLVRAWNSFSFFDRCIDSVLSQKNADYTILFVDDCSDYTKSQKNYIRKKLAGHICIFNRERKFSLRNAYEAIHTYTSENDLICNLDGDDWLTNTRALKILGSNYSKEILFTYGNCSYYQPGGDWHNKLATEVHDLLNRRYSLAVTLENSYRSLPFLPLHLRTWRVAAFKKIPLRYFLRPDKSWIRYCEDQAMFYPLLEMSRGQYAVIEQPLSAYNISNPNNDFKINRKKRLFDEVAIRRMTPLSPL